MLAVPEGDVVRRRIDVLVLRALTGVLAHAREAEGVKRRGFGVVRVVVVRRVRCGYDRCTLGDIGAVGECDVLENFTRE